MPVKGSFAPGGRDEFDRWSRAIADTLREPDPVDTGGTIRTEIPPWAADGNAEDWIHRLDGTWYNMRTNIAYQDDGTPVDEGGNEITTTGAVPPWAEGDNSTDWHHTTDGRWLHTPSGKMFGPDGNLIFDDAATPDWSDGMEQVPGGWYDPRSDQYYDNEGNKLRYEGPPKHTIPNDPTGGEPQTPISPNLPDFPGYDPSKPSTPQNYGKSPTNYVPGVSEAFPPGQVDEARYTMPNKPETISPGATPPGGAIPGLGAPPTGGISGPSRTFAPYGEPMGQMSAPRTYGGLPRSTGPWGQPGAWYEGQGALAAALRGN